MKRSVIALALFFLTMTIALAGINLKKWDPIPPADLALKENPNEKGARAMYLFRHAEYSSGQYTEHAAIKIFTEAGRDYANIQFDTEVDKVVARTIRPDGTTVEIQKDEIMKKLVAKKSGSKRQVKTFAFPDVTPGCVVEYKFNHSLSTWERIIFIWNFQQDIYCREAWIEFDSSEIKSYNRFNLDIFKVANIQHEELKGRERYSAADIPAVPDESYLPPANEAAPRLLIFYAFQKVDGAEKLDLKTQEGQNQYVELFWKQLSKENAESDYKFMNKKKEIAELKTNILTQDTRNVEPARKVYDYIMKNYRNTDFEQRSEEERSKIKKSEKEKENTSVANTIINRCGTSQDIMRLCVALLREAGLEAKPAYVCSRDKGLFRKWLLLDQYTRSIVAVKNSNGYSWLDPSTPYCNYGDLPWAKQSAPVMVLNPDSGEFIMTPLLPPENNKLSRRVDLAIDGRKIKGKMVLTFTGSDNIKTKNDLDDETEEERRSFVKDYLETDIKGVELLQYSFKNLREQGQELVIEAEFTTPEILVQTKNRLMVVPGILGKNQTNDFTKDRRSVPVFMEAPFIVEDEITFTIPEEFQCEALPPPVKFENALGRYAISLETKDTRVTCRRVIIQNEFYIPSEKYFGLKIFYDMARKGDETTVVLKRKGA